MGTEIELKLAIAAQDAARLKRHPVLGALKPTRRKLHTLYFDTPDFDLYQQRAAWRLRRVGYRWIQTVKMEGQSEGALSRRPEWEVQVTGNQPDWSIMPEEVHAHITHAIFDRLTPCFSTEFERTAWEIDYQGATIELALDQGAVKAGDASLPISEIELELKSGPAHALFQLARELLDSVPLSLDARSKAMRGYSLAGAHAMQPIRSAAQALDKHATAHAAWRYMASRALGQLVANLPGLMQAEDPEYLHQARIALRRLLDMSRLGSAAGIPRRAWADDLKWLMRELSAARDWDVLLRETLPAIRQTLPPGLADSERFEDLLAHAESLRHAAHLRARAALTEKRVVTAVLDLGEMVLAENHAGPGVKNWAQDALRKRFKTLFKLGTHFSELAPEARHELRIAAKKCRYALEAFASLYGQPALKAGKALAALQNTLGAENDLLTASRLLHEIATTTARPEIAFTAGLCEGRLIDAPTPMSQTPQKAWKAVQRLKPFWQ